MRSIIYAKVNKSKVERYFQSKFPIESLWNRSLTNGNTFDEWHKKRVEDLDKIIKNHINQPKNGTKRVAYAISAKLLNTFMHQLMKYKEFRYLYKYLHLPLDGQVFKNLARELKEIENPQSLKELRDLAQEYKNQAYTLNYDKYKKIQEKLNCLQKYLNKVLKSEGIKLESRVELNCILWPN